MKTYKKQAWTFGIIAGVLLIVGVVIVWKYMQLRKSIAIVQSKTSNPSSSVISAAVDTVTRAAQEVAA